MIKNYKNIGNKDGKVRVDKYSDQSQWIFVNKGFSRGCEWETRRNKAQLGGWISGCEKIVRDSN